MDRRRLSWSGGAVTLVLLPVVAGGLVFGSSSRSPHPERAPGLPDAPAATAPGSSSAVAAGESSAIPEPTAAERPAAPLAATDAGLRSLRSELEASLPIDRWREARWGVMVTSLDRGDTLFSLNPHQPLSPASNMKLLTTGAALHHLGPDFRFRTFLMSDAVVEGGVLQGDLVLYGTGDPSLTGAVRASGPDPLREFARRLRERGVREVSGDVIGDGSYFEGPLRPVDWHSGYLNEWFAAPVDALQYSENLVLLRIRPGTAAGRPVRVEKIPEGAPLPVQVRARTVRRRTQHRVWALRDVPGAPVSITGQIRVQDPDVWRRMTVSDPALYAARELLGALEDEGIRVGGDARTVRDRKASVLPGGAVWAPALGSGASSQPRVLLEHRSAPLVDLLWVVNRKSHNLYAESVFRTLGRVVDGDGSFEGGARVVRRYLVEEVGILSSEARVVDGSGLSSSNRVSPHVFVRLLDHMARSPHWPAFWSTLPQAGNWRELRRMYRTPAAGNLRAKTGTLRDVSALSGVVEARNGERLAFSIVSNDVPSTSAAKAVEDRIGVRLATFARPAGPGSAPPSPVPADFTADED